MTRLLRIAKDDTQGWRALLARPREERAQRCAERFVGLGLDQPERIAESFARLLEVSIFATAAERVIQLLPRAASPLRAILALEDCVASLEQSRGDASPLFVDPILTLVLELAGASGSAARLFSRDPALAIELGFRERKRASVAPDHRDSARRMVTAAAADTVVFDRLIRRYRNRQMLAIALHELREGDIRASSGELAELAGSALQAALWHHLPLLEQQLGPLTPTCEHAIVGMGKLGGRELNFSSDIDLIYFFEHDEGAAGPLSLHQFHLKLFERVTRSLAEITEHGFVFRVDLDLRPEGRTGTLANSLASAERYYEQWGRTWERQAWLRARPVAGDPELGARVMSMMRPFVFRRSLDLAAIADIFAMKGKIDEARTRAAKRPMGGGLDLKLGEGGIREIEFFVQALQLLYGGRDPTLRQTNTLEALVRLEAAGIVNARDRALLGDAYLFLRKVEHRLQIVEDQQTHTMPLGHDALEPLARSLGDTIDGLREGLERRMLAAHELFVLHIGRSGEPEPIPPEVEALTDPSTSEAERLEVLAGCGVKSPLPALESLERATLLPGSPLHAHSTRRLLGQRLLSECLGSADADRALRHLSDLIRSLVLHGSYFAALERPLVLRGVARVLGASDLLARILVSSPGLLPAVLLEHQLPEPAALARDLRARLAEADDLELELSTLRSLKQEETLRVAMAELAALIDTVTASQRLTSLAELLIRTALELATREMVQRYGEPASRSGVQLAIVAGGTLGAREMGYRSDVDLSLIFDGEGETTGGEKEAIGCPELYTRIAQRTLSLLTLRTREGELYAVDARLRPSGNQGALVASLANFEAYHQRGAALWERQALVRSRTVAGPPALAERIDRAIARASYGTPVEDAARRVHEMRVRIEKERSLPGRGRRRGSTPVALQERLDLKLGRGGLVEAEFLVQYLLIQHGHDRPEIRTTSTRDALRALEAGALLRPGEGQRLIRAVDRLRAVRNWLRLAHDAPIDELVLEAATLRPLALAVGYQGENAQELLRRDLLSDTAAIHQSYLDSLDPH